MIMLALQIFLLLLAAYIAGCMAGCMLRRALYTPKSVQAGVALPIEHLAPAVPRGAPLPGASRFERALTGTGRFPVPQTIAESSEPVVEVRPRHAPQPEVISSDPLPAAEIEEVESATSQPEEELGSGEEFLQSEPTAPTESVAPAAELSDEPPQEDVDVVAEVVLPPPPAPPPPPAYATPHVASYAAVAAAAAAARAALVAPADDADWDAMREIDGGVAEAAGDFDVDAGAQPPAEVVPEAEEPPLRPDDADDLKRIRAIDRDLELRLNEAGVYRYSDIANWTAADAASMSEALDVDGRIEQENWIEQASILARGETGFAPRPPRVSETVSAVGMAAAAANAAASAAAQQSAAPDRFTRIIGIDRDTEQALYDMGFSRYAEIAQWTAADVEVVEEILERPGRVGLDNWIEQARVLARYAGEAAAPRPVKLLDAIRENKAKPAQPDAARSDIVGLRSVRSEALRGDMPSASDRADDLKRIRGIGVLIEKRLNALGITSYEQVANWTRTDIDIVSTQLDFRGRIERENWIEQARILASGGQTEFSRRVDRGDVETSKDT
jgi:predicted flap endonuclease-1-like 5' DNA nuclease